MRATTHQIAGVGLAVVAAAALEASTADAAVLVAGAWLGSLLPDADRAGSRIYRTRRFERRAWPLRILGWFARLPLRALILLGHRGLTHSLLAVAAGAAAAFALASLLVPSVASAAAAGVGIGYLAHVAADACTPSGVPLLAPLSRHRHHLLPRSARIPTGSLRELAVAAVLTAGAVAATLLLTG
ncbi:metal-dependent hydrolase [Solirubrobacter phytolaccae]|uniref:Metal-dependent hydrolase n=1 Tax=Solirubrobacter phytolaccae TaxID=1404360 RepID=A0A9X3S9R7_9ACTN|nr:metal-dependent hydrolase [Solirubrobacter phytolaccae]MDA0182898.1 metal-dependent hydrolase [Solirubrobacter phytolaccae]